HRPRASFVSRAISIIYIAVLSGIHVDAATTCAAKVQAALKTVQGEGIGVSCCKADEPDCQWSVTGDCDAGSTLGWCMAAGTSKACAIAYGPDPDEPCGAYGGPVGKTYGMSPVGTGYKVPLQSPAIEASLRANWDRVSKLSDVGLCCPPADGAGGACHVGEILMLSQNPCNAGEYEFKCYGTGTHGLCSAYRNVSSTTEIGQYYFVNFDDNAPKPVSSVSTLSTASSTPAASGASPTASSPVGSSPTGSSSAASPLVTPGSTSSFDSSASGALASGSPSTASQSQVTGITASGTSLAADSSTVKHTSGVNVAAVVVSVILVLLLLGLAIWFVLRRRRRLAENQRLAASTEHPVYPYTDSSIAATGLASPSSVWTDSVPMTQVGSSITPYQQHPPMPPMPVSGKYAHIQQQQQQRPFSPPLPPYSLYSEP
ncbi:hypothetical protein EXIGLDRAFT_727330, partial [Exidia glandulosa HHB12029]